MTETQIEDPVYVHSRREAVIILLLWGLSFAWTVPYSYLYGFSRPQDQPLEIVAGMPSWVFWGIALPWFVTGVIAVLLCQFYIQDDDLGVAEGEGE